MRRHRALLTVLSALVPFGSLACVESTSDPDGGLTVDAGSFTITASASTLDVRPGGTVAVDIVVTPPLTEAATLSISGLPSTLTGGFEPARLTSKTTLRISASESAVAGSYPFTVTAQLAGRSASVTLSVEVKPVEAALALTLDPTTATLLASGNVSFAVRTTRSASLVEPVTVALTGLPEFVTATPLTIAPDATEGTITLRATHRAPTEISVPVGVRGTAGSVTADATLGLELRAPTNVLDTEFGDAGVYAAALTTENSTSYGEVFDAILQPDDKIVYVAKEFGAGHFDVYRIDAEGNPDTTFGTGGAVHHLVGPALASGEARGVERIADGRLVVAGLVDATIIERTARREGPGRNGGPQRALIVARYTATGTLDTSFGATEGGPGQGYIQTSFNINEYPSDGDELRGRSMPTRAVAGPTSGTPRTVVALSKTVYNGECNTPLRTVLYRFNHDGSLDDSFGAGGISAIVDSTCFSSGNETVGDLTVQQDGKLVVVSSVNHGETSDVRVTRYTTDGQLDTTFGDEQPEVFAPTSMRKGFVTFRFEQSAFYSYGRAIAVRPNGQILVAGTTQRMDGQMAMAAAQLTSDGRIDSSFGSSGAYYVGAQASEDGGVAITTALEDGGGSAQAWSMALSTTGHVWLAGSKGESLPTFMATSDYLMVRLSPSGSPDTTLATNGRRLLDYRLREGALRMLRTPNGRVALAGIAGSAKVDEPIQPHIVLVWP
jgi:uncharacterized delta-60 repeat protein